MGNKRSAVFLKRTLLLIQPWMCRRITKHNSPPLRPTGRGWAIPFPNPPAPTTGLRITELRRAPNFALNYTQWWINSGHLHHFIIFNLHQRRWGIKSSDNKERPQKRQSVKTRHKRAGETVHIHTTAIHQRHWIWIRLRNNAYRTLAPVPF
jgi:hypothetical protein